MTITIIHKHDITFPQLDFLLTAANKIYTIESELKKMNAELQAFVDDVNGKIGAINTNLTKINADTTGLLAKVEELQSQVGDTLPQDAKDALQAIRDQVSGLVAATGAIDALVPDAVPGEGDPNNV